MPMERQTIDKVPGSLRVPSDLEGEDRTASVRQIFSIQFMAGLALRRRIKTAAPTAFPHSKTGLLKYCTFSGTLLLQSILLLRPKQPHIPMQKCRPLLSLIGKGTDFNSYHNISC